MGSTPFLYENRKQEQPKLSVGNISLIEGVFTLARTSERTVVFSAGPPPSVGQFTWVLTSISQWSVFN